MKSRGLKPIDAKERLNIHEKISKGTPLDVQEGFKWSEGIVSSSPAELKNRPCGKTAVLLFRHISDHPGVWLFEDDIVVLNPCRQCPQPVSDMT
jgi:hypothetical protein